MTENEHILTCLAEECAEVAKNVSKALRFGLDDTHPEGGITNSQKLFEEMTDLLAVWEMCEQRGLVPEMEYQTEPALSLRIDAKKARVREWMDYARTQGAITE